MRNRLGDYPSVGQGQARTDRLPVETTAPAKILKAFTDCVGEYPVASLLVTASLGAIVGWYLKRR